MQHQAQSGSQLEETPQPNPRGTLDAKPATVDEGNHPHSLQEPPRDMEALIPKTGKHQRSEVMDEHRSQRGSSELTNSEFHLTAVGSQPSLHLLGPEGTTTRSEIPTPNQPDGRDLHLLTIEGRGVCGLSALIILKEVLRQYQYLKKLPQLPRPCDVFDLAGGAGTGGIIAIMLFRLGMTVDEAIMAYANLSAEVFNKPLRSRKTNASRLENAITKVVCSSCDIYESQGQMARMLDEEGPKCFVTCSNAKNMSYPTLFRTYASPRLASHNCTIVEAARATTAEEPFFPSIDIGDANMEETFIHGGWRINSPVKAVLQEVKSIFPDQSVCCMLSIGSGSQGIIGLEGTSTTNRAQVLKKLMHEGEQISGEVAKELWDKEVFTCLLNVDHGLERIGFDDWERLGDIRTHTQKYLETFDVIQKVSRLVQTLNQCTASTSSTVKETLTNLGKFVSAFIPMFREHWGTVISEFIRIAKPSKAATETLNLQCALLRDTLGGCLQGKDITELPDGVKGNIRELLEGLVKTFHDSPGQDNPMAHLNTEIQRFLQRFWVKGHIAGTIVVQDILKYLQKDDSMRKTFTRLEQHAINRNLATLNVSPFAPFNSSEALKRTSCFKGTRLRLLNEIANWIAGDDPTLAPIYILDGVAGIGKSTIAQTVAEHAAGINALGASFFFSRNDDKRKTIKTFFPSIAYQLAYYDKGFSEQINEALLHTPHVVTQLPLAQFSTLIMEPLREGFAVGNPILIVIDALDECELDGDSILKIFADWIRNLPRLRLFITTRPEHHIRIVLDRYHHLKRFHLQDIEKSVVQSDIRLYLDFHLSDNQVRDKLPDLKCTWQPAREEVDVLIGICGTLFIIASTAVKFILDSKRSDPGKQLSRLLRGVSRRDFSGSKHTTAMDTFYTQILLAAVPGDDDDDDEDANWFEQYQIVVGTIVALQYPLPCVALSALLDFDSDDVTRALSHLYSLVAPTGQDLTFRLHHKSFPDFVTNTLRCEQRFLINLKTRHLELGKRCLSIMNARLEPNVCNLGPGDRFEDNSFTQYLTQGGISPELAYASTHWATHLDIALTLDDEAGRLLEDFARLHFLAWLEVLSVIGQVDTAYASLGKTGKLLDACKTTAKITREIFHDGCRFIALNIELFRVAAGHVFSAFAFVPQDTKLFQTYGGQKGIDLGVVSGHEKTWNPTISIMTGHSYPIHAVTFSGDGMKLASASGDRTVRLWDGETGAEIAVLQGHLGAVKSVIFSPDGKTLASASDDTTVRVWDGQTGAEIAILQGHLGAVKSVVFSPDGTTLASASQDETVRLWDGRTGAEIAVLQGHLGAVKSVVFSPDGTTLASASQDETVRLWEGRTGAEIAVLRGHSDWVTSVAFFPDGTRLVSVSHDRTVRLWDSLTGAEIAVLQGHSNLVYSGAFSPDGTRLASVSPGQVVRLWDSLAGAEIAVLQGHSALVYSVVFSPDGTRLASASGDRTVRLWDGHTGAEIAVLQGHSASVYSVVFSPDGTRLASASRDRTVRLWDGQTIAEIGVLQVNSSESVNSVVFSPNGKRMASASRDEMVRLWDGRSGAKIAVLQTYWKFVAFSPDSTRLASTDDKTVGLWNGQTGAEIAVLRGHSDRINSMVFSPDGTRLASASSDATARLWDGQTGSRISVLRGHRDSVNRVVFSPDGTRLASASSDATLGLWDGQTGIKIAVLRGHSDRVNSVVFSLDGTRLASASRDETVQLWNCQTGARIAVLHGHSKSVKKVVFSADGTRLASSSYDNTVQLWDGQTGATIASFPGLEFVSFNPRGSRLLLINHERFYQFNHSIGDELAMPLSIDPEFRPHGVQVPGSNVWIILLKRKRPSLQGLLAVKVDDPEGLRFASLCWFPPDLPVICHTVSSLSRVAVGCTDGRVLLLDIDLSLL